MAYLTKTRFKEAMACPDRMFYYGKKETYADSRSDDDFLQELAKTGIQVGELAKTGIQVGELAKSYFPGGKEIETLKNEDAIAQTNELLKEENIILYEAALSFGNLLVRVDVLIKRGSAIELIEVKSKSFFKESELFTKTGISSEWKEYVYDIAFQFYVASKLLPDFKIKGYLCLIDKKATCTVDGLYNKFKLKKIENGYKVDVDSGIEVGAPLLSRIELTEVICNIINGCERIDNKTYSFIEYVAILEAAVQNDVFLNIATGRHCKSCPYKATELNRQAGLRSGFEECWAKKEGFNDDHFSIPHVFDLWNLNYRRLEKFLLEKRFFLKDINQEDLLPKTKPKSTTKRNLTPDERQWLQIELATKQGLGS